MNDLNEMVKLIQRIDKRSSSDAFVKKSDHRPLDEELQRKIKTFLAGGKTIREIAKSLDTTYYQVQKVYSASWTTVAIHYRTIRHNGFDFQLRMLPYQLTTGEITKGEAEMLIEKGNILSHAIEIRMGHSLWLDFDGDEIAKYRESLLDFFYNTIDLSYFANSVALSIDFVLSSESLPMLAAFFSAAQKNSNWPDIAKRIKKQPLGKALLDSIDACPPSSY